jgi:hypothetical protein
MQKTATINEAWGRKYPEQVVLAITKNAEIKVKLKYLKGVIIYE